MTIETLDTPVPGAFSSRGGWTLPEGLAAVPAAIRSAGPVEQHDSIPRLPGQRRPVLETVLPTLPGGPGSVDTAAAEHRGSWVVPPSRVASSVQEAVQEAAPSRAAATIWVVPPPRTAPCTPPVSALVVVPAPVVSAPEPAATAERLLPTKLLPTKLLPTKLLPIKLLPTKLLPTKLLPIKLLPNRSALGWRRPATVGALAVLTTLSAAAPTFGGDEAKSLTVTIDGQVRTISTAAPSVGEALSAVGIAVSDRDVVAPALDTAVTEGGRINLRRARPLTLRIDGAERTVWTTATTLSGALSELGIEPGRYELSASRSRRLGLDGLSVVGTSLLPVTLTVGTSAPTKIATPTRTVADLLAAQGIRLGKADTVKPAADTPITGGEQIVVTRVKIEQDTVTEKIPQPKPVTVDDPELGKGKTKVTKGRTGIREITVRTTTVNGKASKKQVANSIVRKATPDVTAVGTRETGAAESWSVPWDDMAFCESTGRWDVNTGNGTYGGLQFMTPTWLAYGGGEFAPRADLASKEQQIIVAERLYAVEGLAPWHCARLLGWGFGKYQG